MNTIYGLDPKPGKNLPWTPSQQERANAFQENRDRLMQEAMEFYRAMKDGATIGELGIQLNFMREQLAGLERQKSSLRREGISERDLCERRMMRDALD